jgi:hypothetical protein
MTTAPIVGVAEHYAQFLKLARARITELGVSYETVDEICGFPARYTSKLLCEQKTMSVFSFFTLARALALLPSFAHDETQLELLHRHPEWMKYRRTAARFRSRPGGAIKFNNYRDFYRQIGRKGARIRHARALAMREMREMKRKAAMARWSKNGRATENQP